MPSMPTPPTEAPPVRDDASVVDVDQVVPLPVDQLHPAQDNPRAELGDVAELAASIAAVGLLQPLLVTPRAEGGWMVVAGHRRLAALQAAGQGSASCVVRALDDTQRQEAMLVENIQREGLTPLEEARAYARLVELGSSQRRIASRVGRNQSHVSKRLALLALPPAAIAALDDGRITVADAVALAKLRDDPDTIDKIVQRGHWNIPAQVDREMDDRRRRTARAESITELQDDGQQIVDLELDHGPWSLTYRNDLRPLGAEHGHLPVDPAVHDGEACHAVAVLYDGAQVPVCTDPASHPEGRDLLQPPDAGNEPRPDRAAVREANARVRAAQDRREPLLRRLLDRAGDVDQLTHVAHITVLACRGNSTYQRNKIACALLGLQVETNDWGSSDPDGTLRRHAAGGDTERLRTALAIALAEGERTPRLWQASDGGSWADETTRAHFDHLRDHGHTLDPTEAHLLTGNGAPLIDALADLEPEDQR